jgi:CDP-6-deoxy-D-xylo-4-hexulose-3-dehydrase
MCNSGSSANLLALSALTSPMMGGEQLRKGDEVIVAAAGFPTSVNPVIQNGLVPVFVDVDLETWVPTLEMIAGTILLRPKVKAVMLAHTLGNPWPVDQLTGIDEFFSDIWLIEDNCDALGSILKGSKTGTFGHLATQSFYPAHHITTGEGGAVMTSIPTLKKIVESYRDWGRDCWCPPGKENTCGRRFEQDFPDLPYDYDHKYIYSHVGYNLKATDFQAAIGYAQMDRLPMFVMQRIANFNALYEALEPWREFLILPKATSGSAPSWFGFAITIREDAPFTRRDIVQFLNEHKIGTRFLFGGNLLKQPAYRFLNAPRYPLDNTNLIASNTFWVGVWPGIDQERRDYMIEAFNKFLEGQ